MIKAIIFDCFGVLTSDGWLPFKQKYFGSDPEKFEEATRQNALANSNRIPYGQFLATVASMAGVSQDELNQEMHKSVSDNRMLEYIGSLKKSYKIGMLSNISGDWLGSLFSDEQVRLFDAIALSYETGYAKPDPKAYYIILKRLDCLPEECVYIDDQQVFVDAAAELGMTVILYSNFESFKEQITAILEVSDSNK
jgi:putative hydrolase of the HAD superfamily